MKAKNYIISAVLAGLLIGCGGGSSSSNNNNSTSEVVDTTKTAFTVLTSKEAFSASMQSEIDALDTQGWHDAKDSSIISISANGSKIVAGSKYHNALSVVDIASHGEKYNSFAVLSDSGHGKLSSSGASENYLRDAVVLKSGYIIANIPPKSFSSKTYDKDSYGLFKTQIKDDNSINSVAESKRVKEMFSSFVVSGDEQTIVAYDSEKNLISYDANLNEKASAEVANLEAFIFSDNSTLYGVFKDDSKNMYVSKISLTDTSITIDTNKIAIENSADYVEFSENNLVLVSDDGEITVVNTSNNSVKNYSTKIRARSVDLSPNGNYLAIGSNDKLNIISMSSEYKDVQFDLVTNQRVRGVAFIDNDTISYAKNRNEVAVIDLTDTKQAVSTKDILARYVQNIEADMNNGKSTDAIANNLKLIQKLNNVAFTWTSSKPSVISSEGNVTRGSNDEAVTLSVSAKREGESATYEKSYNITVRANLAEISSSNVRRLPTEGKNRPDYMSVNSDGSIAISPVQVYAEDGKSSTYMMSSYKAGTDGKFTEVSKEKTFGSNQKIVGTGINGSFAIGLASSTEANATKGKIFSVALGNDGKLADTTTKSIDIVTGSPVRIEYNSNNSIAAVMIKEPDESYIAEIYNIDNLGNITLVRTIDMGKNGYRTYGPIAVNEDGTKVFQRDGDGVYAISSDGSSKYQEIDNIARVWSGKGRVFVHTYGGIIYSFDENLGNKKEYNTATYGRMYGGEVREIDGKTYYFVPVTRANSDSLNGIYKFEILDDGSLKGVGFSSLLADEVTRGADRMSVSGDGKVIVYSSTSRS